MYYLTLLKLSINSNRDFSGSGFCPTGFTFGFWFRGIRSSIYETAHSTIINQDYGQVAGIAVHFGKDIFGSLQLTDRYFLCTRWPVEPDHYLRWHFYAVTYDPATDNAWCILDTELRQMTITTYSQSQPPALKFGGGQPFFIDDIVYYPKFSTAEMIEAVYNQSKLLIIIC